MWICQCTAYFKFIPSTCTHSHSLKPFEDSETMGLKMDIVEVFFPPKFYGCCIFECIWVVLSNCVPLGVGNFKLVFEGNLLLQCKYFYFLSLYVDVSDNKNSNDCQSCVLCTLNRTDVAK